MKKLTKAQFMQVSILLFGLFFGAGNLIFPPLLGNQAGGSLWPALIGFSITAVLFPVLGSIAVGKSEGLANLAGRVGPKFALVFSMAVYLSIGPGLAIPRAGSVPFEMAVAPYIPANFNVVYARIAYTLIFFTLALYISIRPSKLIESVGKYLTPALLILIAFMFVKAVSLPANVAQPTADYASSPLAVGFLKGYETLDAVAALNFGLVISMAIAGFGIEDKKEITAYNIKTGFMAGTLLFIVYAMLSYLGHRSSASLAGAENGAIILTEAVRQSLGGFGVVLLAIIFTLACLTTCVGLISSVGEYFYNLSKGKISYEKWVVIWTVFSFVVANFGLNTLLTYSVPVLNLLYPVSLLLIVLGVSHDLVDYPKLAYQLGAFVAVALPLIDLLGSLGLNIPLLTSLESSLPFSDVGLSWMIPSLVVVFAVSLLSKVFARQSREVEDLA